MALDREVLSTYILNLKLQLNLDFSGFPEAIYLGAYEKRTEPDKRCFTVVFSSTESITLSFHFS